jgi:pentalenic acid synthase
MPQPPTSELMAYPKLRDPACPLAPPADYLKVQQESPVTKVLLPSGREAWLVTGHAFGRQILTEQNVSVDRHNAAYPIPAPNPEAVLAQLARWTQILLGDDPPRHTERRRMLIPEFSVRRAQAATPRIQDIVDGAIDNLVAAGRPADLVEHVALSVPSLVICEVLGVPYEDHEFFQTRTILQLERDATAEAKAKAIDELLGYFETLISEKEKNPTDDLLGRLIVNNRESGAFDHEALVALGLLLLVGGHETTGNVISLGVASLLDDPEQLTLLRSDPSVIPSAVEEFLRYFSPATATNRVATADIDLGGTTIKAGEGIIVHLSTMAFSHGIHQCMGQNLARVELTVVFETLFRRLPELRLTKPFTELSFKFRSLAFGLQDLEVTW